MRLKKWVRVVLTTIAIISIIVMAGDCESTLWFIIGHLIACGTFTLSAMTLIKYGE